MVDSACVLGDDHNLHGMEFDAGDDFSVIVRRWAWPLKKGDEIDYILEVTCGDLWLKRVFQTRELVDNRVIGLVRALAESLVFLGLGPKTWNLVVENVDRLTQYVPSGRTDY